MKWIEVQIKTTTEAEEVVANILYEAGVGGLAIEDPNDILAFTQNEDNWDYIDPSLLKHDFEGIIIKAYFPESEDLLDKIELIKQNIEKIPQYNLDKGLGEVTVSEVDEKDWAETWKKYYKPKKIGEKIVIVPSWEEYEREEEDIIIELDPGMAFGTGTHETTSMCIKQLEKYIKPDYTVFDVGCGSGILSIVSAKLGAKKVIAVDIDEVPVRVSKENIELNKVSDIVDVRRGNLLDVVDEKADLVVSNIIAEVIVELTQGIVKYLDGNSIFIASGIIVEKMDMVKEALEKAGFQILEVDIMKDWVCIVSKLEKDVRDE
ncbi:50S ribosomal protein L11 methyltransferase [Anaerosalibacter sp. Marseille-P3206]|uniref:50S ribosomal protein L11 methyltransferase n=1 Tax=Anaerosalibacter sp. Marseille-P3206 TaxID=1871005 RepID=UPI000987A833|nr:50S ribosomal protein L11 methyltransferase [Anaerosalibacter sp. Marseille-P3206]